MGRAVESKGETGMSSEDGEAAPGAVSGSGGGVDAGVRVTINGSSSPGVIQFSLQYVILLI
jgi:hypothetical protein